MKINIIIILIFLITSCNTAKENTVDRLNTALIVSYENFIKEIDSYQIEKQSDNYLYTLRKVNDTVIVVEYVLYKKGKIVEHYTLKQ